VHIKAYLKDFFGIDMHNAISNISGGIGKNDDSINAIIKRAAAPYLESAQDKVQL
jgi:hypothetical protein